MKKLAEKVNRLQMHALSGFLKFMNSERGDTNFISIIIIVAIVIALAAIFWGFAKGGMDTISKAFETFLKKLGV